MGVETGTLASRREYQQIEALRRVESWLACEREQRTLLGSAQALAGVEEHGGGRCLYTYDEHGDLVQIVEADGRVVSFGYDDLRRLVQASHADGSSSSYRYGDNDRLIEIDAPGGRCRFEHDASGRLVTVHRGSTGAVAYRYDEQGRVIAYRTAHLATQQEFDQQGRVTVLRQVLDGVAIEMRLSYDAAARLSEVYLPGSSMPMCYEWDAKGRPARIRIADRAIARFEYVEPAKVCRVHLANGVVEHSMADSIDSRPLARQWARNGEVLEARTYAYDATGKLRHDGRCAYEYDALGRLSTAYALDTPLESGQTWHYRYDTLDNRTDLAHAGLTTWSDQCGRLTGKSGHGCEWGYRYDDAGQLREVLAHGDVMARFTYDAKGRLAAMCAGGCVERYLYGPADELFAVTDSAGRPLRLYVHTPFGCLAEMHGSVEAADVHFLHQDERGTCYLVTDQYGEVIARHRYDPYGLPLSSTATAPWFSGRRWNPVVRMYYFSARWYDPALGRFLTPDPYTARPDDTRILHALGSRTAQVWLREQLLPGWLRRPRSRNPYAFCGNDPVNCVDPNGHWSFGRVLLSLLGAIWTLPNTIFGLLVEIMCLVGEVIRWLVWLVTAGHVSWATPGFDVAASGRLNAFALVFRGGWLGSFSSLLGITFGNVFFVYTDWENSAVIAPGGNVSPPAYGGTETFPRRQALYEHELRHTNQYGWFGPFFHLGLPLFGIYEWDIILHGYQNSRLETDAREHGGI
jgi:RHS repeat-associated protein